MSQQTSRTLRAGLYARVSTEDRGQDPETQLRPLREYAERRGFDVVGEYVDHASGTTEQRPRYQRLLEAARKREIDVACASIDLAGAEIAMSTKIGRERLLQKAFRAIEGDYDFICIDTPPSLGLLTINALTAADKVIVPVQCEYLSMRGLIQLQNTLQMIRENLNPDVEIEGILPTMLDSRTVHAKEAVEILEENFGDLVFKSRIRKAVKFAEAPVRGASVLKYDPNGNAAGYYRELAKEVLTHGSS